MTRLYAPLETIGLALILATIGVSNAYCAQVVAAADWPQRPLRIVTPNAPGSPPDLMARILAEPLSAVLRQPVIVDNRPGAAGTIALAAVARSTPDGHTIGVLSIGQLVAPSLLTHIAFDVTRDFVPIVLTNWETHLLIVRADAAWKSVHDLVTAARARPGQFTFASGGSATPAHLSGEFFKRHAGIDIRHIPFKGPLQGVAGVVSNQVDMMFAATSAAAPHVSALRLRALATPAPHRVQGFPDVPTMRELGYNDVEIRGWHGLVAAAKTPPAVVTKLAGEVTRIIAAPAVVHRFAAIGFEAPGQDPEVGFVEFVRSEYTRWTRIAQEAGIRAE